MLNVQSTDRKERETERVSEREREKGKNVINNLFYVF